MEENTQSNKSRKAPKLKTKHAIDPRDLVSLTGYSRPPHYGKKVHIFEPQEGGLLLTAEAQVVLKKNNILPDQAVGVSVDDLHLGWVVKALKTEGEEIYNISFVLKDDSARVCRISFDTYTEKVRKSPRGRKAGHTLNQVLDKLKALDTESETAS